jgi:ankyrin repeat protein
MPLLHRALQHRSPPDVILCLVDENDDILQIKSSKDGKLPLHCALEYHASVEVIRHFMDRWGPALRMTDAEGMLPLHFAVRHEAPVEAIQYVMGKWEQPALRHDDSTGRLPLHLAAEHATLDVVSVLAHAYPPALERKDCAGRLPLHVAAQCRALEVVEFLVGVSFHALQERTSDGLLPVQVAAARYDAKLDVIYFLARAGPEALGRSAVPKKAP